MDDLISRQALMKEFANFVRDSNNSDFAQTPTWNDAISLVESMPSAQPEITEAQVKEYCEKRCLVVLSSDAFYRWKSATMWHLVASRKDLPALGIPVIVEYDRGITVAILDDAWVQNQPMWYVNNEPIGMWCAVDRWMEIPK